MEEAKLKILLIIIRDIKYGLRTITPIWPAQAASFNIDLVEQMARITAIGALLAEYDGHSRL
jgi:beta-glucosidase-like glycosyl hydrolase